MNLESQILNIPIEDILPNRFQPRLNFDDSALKELAASIKEHGIIQPLVVRRLGEKYEIIAGERRYKAAKMAGLTSVPAIVSSITDNQSAEVAIIENVQRKDLSSIEEAKSYKMLLDKGYLTQDELAKKMGLSQSAISNKLRLLSLSNKVQEALMVGKISERHARSLLQIEDSDLQDEWLNKILDERLTVKELDRRLKDTTNKKDTKVSNEKPKEEPIKKSKNNDIEDTDEIPLVSLAPNIAEIREKATDILAPKKEDIVDIASTSTSKENSNGMPNKFFNFLEYEEANMNIGNDIDSEIKPKKEFLEEDNSEALDDISLEKEIKEVQKEEEPLKDEEEIEMLDFDIPTDNSIEKKDMTVAISLVNNLKEDLKNEKYNIDFEEVNTENEIKYTIIIKKDN